MRGRSWKRGEKEERKDKNCNYFWLSVDQLIFLVKRGPSFYEKQFDKELIY